jgi:hypothetical protein
MLEDLKSKGLIRENPWTDPFQVKYDYLWHHEGRRARMRRPTVRRITRTGTDSSS